MKCDKCGYSDNGSGDWAHACGPVAIQQAPVANERIRELADEAIEDMPGAWNIPDEFCDKFAELFIKECSVALSPMLRDMISRGQAVDLIRQHFGVEQ